MKDNYFEAAMSQTSNLEETIQLLQRRSKKQVPRHDVKQELVSIGIKIIEDVKGSGRSRRRLDSPSIDSGCSRSPSPKNVRIHRRLRASERKEDKFEHLPLEAVALVGPWSSRKGPRVKDVKERYP